MSAFGTKFAAGWIDVAAAGTGDIQYTAPFVAEPVSRWIIELTF
jgi:hypothetical protein